MFLLWFFLHTISFVVVFIATIIVNVVCGAQQGGLMLGDEVVALVVIFYFVLG